MLTFFFSVLVVSECLMMKMYALQGRVVTGFGNTDIPNEPDRLFLLERVGGKPEINLEGRLHLPSY